MDTKRASSWEAAYRRRPSGENTPHPDAGLLNDIFQKNGIRHILDLGCGDGRHLVYFTKQGYRVTGVDYAPTALRLARAWLQRERLSADLICADMKAIPFADSTFDAIVCIAVINHNRIQAIRTTIQEIHRVLQSGGWFFLVVAMESAMPTPDNTKYIKIEHHTYMPTSGHEEGIPHYFFSEEALRKEFFQFSIHDIHRDQRNRACVLMQKSKFEAPKEKEAGCG